jgi:hypothetical protein
MRVPTICSLHGQRATFKKSMAYDLEPRTNKKIMQDETEQYCA